MKEQVSSNTPNKLKATAEVLREGQWPRVPLTDPQASPRASFEAANMEGTFGRKRRRQGAYNTRDHSEPSTERRRQVTAILDRPEERRNPTRYLPEVTGVTSLSRNDIKSDFREIEQNSAHELPPELYEEHEEDDLRINMNAKRPVPMGHEEFNSRYRRFKRWHRRPEELEIDLVRYKLTVQLAREELRRMENQVMEDQDKFAALRLHFLNQVQVLRKEKQHCDKTVSKLENLCQQEAGLQLLRRKPRDQKMKDVLIKLKSQGRQLRAVLLLHMRLTDRLNFLEADPNSQSNPTSATIQPPAPPTHTYHHTSDICQPVNTLLGQGKVEGESVDGGHVERVGDKVVQVPRGHAEVVGAADAAVKVLDDGVLVCRWATLENSFSFMETQLSDEVALTDLAPMSTYVQQEDMDQVGEHNSSSEDTTSAAAGGPLLPTATSLLPFPQSATMMFGTVKGVMSLGKDDGVQVLPSRVNMDTLEERMEGEKAEMLRLRSRREALLKQFQKGQEDQHEVMKAYQVKRKATLDAATKLFRARAEVADIKHAHKKVLMAHGYPNGKLPQNLRTTVQHQVAARALIVRAQFGGGQGAVVVGSDGLTALPSSSLMDVGQLNDGLHPPQLKRGSSLRDKPLPPDQEGRRPPSRLGNGFNGSMAQLPDLPPQRRTVQRKRF